MLGMLYSIRFNQFIQQVLTALKLIARMHYMNYPVAETTVKLKI